MASKRTATSELNHDNWDEDDEPEEAGTFQKASEDVLKNRVIKRAVRRNPIASVRNVENENEKSNIFGGFSFKKNPTTTSFDFLNNMQSSEEPKSNGLSSSPFVSNSTKDVLNSANEKDKDYLAKLKGLNESVSKWIKKHVDENPFISLTPIFNDYEKYLTQLDNENEERKSKKTEHTIIYQKTTSKTEKVEDAFSAPKTTTTIFKGTVEQVAKTGDIAKTTVSSDSTPKFAMPVTSTPMINFKFGANTTQTGFTFGSPNSTPCTFKNVSGPTAAAATAANLEQEDTQDDEDQPPKVEFKEVEEEGHIFKIRCKVFIKKDNTFTDKGVGNLFLKPIPDSEKVQLIVRADTNLGNLLCNFILSESIPIKKKSKKDILLVCLPTPDISSPVPLLLRVKTPEEADTLFQELEKRKR